MIEFKKLSRDKQEYLRAKYQESALLMRLGNKLTPEIVAVLFDGYDKRIINYQWDRFLECGHGIIRWFNGMDTESITNLLYVLHYSDNTEIRIIRNG